MSAVVFSGSGFVKLILTDVDDTVLGFSKPFQAFVHRKGYRPTRDLSEVYSITEWLGVDHETSHSLIVDFLDHVGIDQPPEPCAAEIVPKLQALGYEFVAITACGVDPTFRERRIENLRNIFGFHFKDVHTVDLKGSKKDFLARYEPSVWVEDHGGHACDGADLGHRSFLLDRPYNREIRHPKVIRVATWHDVAEHLGVRFH